MQCVTIFFDVTSRASEFRNELSDILLQVGDKHETNSCFVSSNIFSRTITKYVSIVFMGFVLYLKRLGDIASKRILQK